MHLFKHLLLSTVLSVLDHMWLHESRHISSGQQFLFVKV